MNDLEFKPLGAVAEVLDEAGKPIGTVQEFDTPWRDERFLATVTIHYVDAWGESQVTEHREKFSSRTRAVRYVRNVAGRRAAA